MYLISNILLALEAELSTSKLKVLSQICKSILTCSNNLYGTNIKFFCLLPMRWSKRKQFLKDIFSFFIKIENK